ALLRYALVLAAWGVALATSQRNPCPAPGAISPCTCDYSGINCMKAKTASSLQKAFSGPGPKEHRGLWVQRTPVASFPAGVLGDFKFVSVYVDMNENLTSFSLESLANSKDTLEDLSLFANSLSRIDYDNLEMFASLATLNLGQNKITAIPSGAFKNAKLETLVLSKNLIENIGAFAFAGLPKLQILRMRDNRLRTLDANSMTIFPHHPELKIEVDLCRIKTIDSKAFENTVPLELTLSYNELTSLPSDVFTPMISGMLRNLAKSVINTVPKVFTRGNRFSCRGCEYKWLLPYANSTAMNVILRDFHCVDGKRLANLTSTVIGC
ncbi:unnamed protein product, partial [Ixodes hexagonus]